MLTSNMPLEQGMDADTAAAIQPVFQAYSMLNQCKALGITVLASDLDHGMLQDFETIRAKVDEIHERKSKRGKRH